MWTIICYVSAKGGKILHIGDAMLKICQRLYRFQKYANFVVQNILKSVTSYPNISWQNRGKITFVLTKVRALALLGDPARAPGPRFLCREWAGPRQASSHAELLRTQPTRGPETMGPT